MSTYRTSLGSVTRDALADVGGGGMPIEGGAVVLDESTGAPLAFVSKEAPELRYLLSEGGDPWHTAEHRWGSGFVAGSVAARWNRPDRVETMADGSVSSFDLDPRLRLTIARTFRGEFRERYVFEASGDEPVIITSAGIVTPFRDVYDDAASSLVHGVHAHVWTGGSHAWVIAQPMSGDRPVLGLQLDEGELHAYSIDSRNQFTSSNVRGHIVLQPTDAGRNPNSFGGQSAIVLAPGEQLVIGWSVRFFTGIAEAVREVRASWEPAALVQKIGEPIVLHGVDPLAVTTIEPASVAAGQGGASVTATEHGIVHVDVGSARIALLFHVPVEQLVSARVRFILDRQRSAYRDGVDSDAFVPFDNRTGLPQLISGWPDWSDGAERIGMPALLQQARLRGWVGSEVDGPLERWATFARTRLLDASGAPFWGSDTIIDETRLYNSPWISQFFADQFRLYGRDEDLALAASILERSYELGAQGHLSIGQPEAVVAVAGLLRAEGSADRAAALESQLLATARKFARIGRDLPSHEVNYEQSMVAPLVTLYAVADTLSSGEFDAPLEVTVAWLRAFAGPQPHARIKHIGIRHWDGFWFGALRRWGDVFPHHWSALSAVALSQLPDRFRTEEINLEAEQIFRANLVSFRPDGSATSAFVLPSTIDGIAGYSDDPLANDQDWALTLMLRA